MSLSQSTDRLALPLPVVINTRPIARAAPLSCHLQAAGFTVVDIPMLALQPRPATAVDMAIMSDWLAGNYQALVIVSPTAAASGLAVWQKLEQQKNAQSVPNTESDINTAGKSVSLTAPSHLIAVGEATAAVLKASSLPATGYEVLQPAIANNEGMLAMPEIESLQAGDKLLVWRGLGGRRLLVNTLQARGVYIDSIAWYERTMPEAANLQYQQWLQQFDAQHSTQSQHSKPIVVISSGTAFEHWASVVDQAQSSVSDDDKNVNIHTHSNIIAPLMLADFSYVVLGERLADMVAARQLSYWRVENLAPATILAAIQSSADQA